MLSKKMKCNLLYIYKMKCNAIKLTERSYHLYFKDGIGVTGVGF